MMSDPKTKHKCLEHPWLSLSHGISLECFFAKCIYGYKLKILRSFHLYLSHTTKSVTACLYDCRRTFPDHIVHQNYIFVTTVTIGENQRYVQFYLERRVNLFFITFVYERCIYKYHFKMSYLNETESFYVLKVLTFILFLFIYNSYPFRIHTIL